MIFTDSQVNVASQFHTVYIGRTAQFLSSSGLVVSFSAVE